MRGKRRTRHKSQSGNPGSGWAEGYNKEDGGAQAWQGAGGSKRHSHHQSTGARHPPHGQCLCSYGNRSQELLWSISLLLETEETSRLPQKQCKHTHNTKNPTKTTTNNTNKPHKPKTGCQHTPSTGKGSALAAQPYLSTTTSQHIHQCSTTAELQPQSDRVEVFPDIIPRIPELWTQSCQSCGPPSSSCGLLPFSSSLAKRSEATQLNRACWK